MTSFDGFGGLVAAPVMSILNADMEKAAVRLAEPADAERFLVIGFGAGVGLTALLDAAEPEWILAVDPSQAMVRAATRRLRRHPNRNRVTLIKGTAEDIQPVGPFDAAIAVNSQQLWSPHRDAVAAIARSVKAGGRLVTVTHLWAITKTQTEQAWRTRVTTDLTDAGFAPPTWIESRFRSGHALIMQARFRPDPHRQPKNDTPTSSQ